MSDLDVSKLSDQQLMALIQSGQPVQPTNAQTGAPLNPSQARGVAQYAAAGGYDPQAAPGTSRKPLAQLDPRDAPPPGQYYFDPEGKVHQAPPATHTSLSPIATGIPALDAVPYAARAMLGYDPGENVGRTAKDVARGVNAFASGVPVLGAFADEADAATAAALAPALEGFARQMPHAVQGVMGYDPRKEIGDLPTFQQRYDAARNLQRFDADQFHTEHPNLDTGLKVGGGVAGTVAMLPALGAATAAAGPEAGLLARSFTGAVEGGGIGTADGYGRGNGAWDDPSRVRGAEIGGMGGAALGAGLPLAAQVGRIAYRSSLGKLADAVRGERVVQAPADGGAETIAQAIRAEPATPSDRLNLEASLISAKRDPLAVNASSLDDAYLRIARALKRQEMTPQQAAEAATKLGPLGVLADTGEGARDLMRAAMNRPGAGGTIAENNLTPRQAGIFDPDTGTWLARPSATRITDQAKAGLGLEGKDFHTEDAALIAGRKAAADPAYEAMRAHPPVAAADLADFSASPMFAAAYKDARKIAAKAFVKLPDGTEKIVPLPEQIPAQMDWRTLDLMKQAMDDTISTSAQQGIGATSRGASKGYLQRFVGKLDTLNPDYATARDAFAGPSAMQDALAEGRGLLSEDAPVIAADIASRPESERQMLRLGAYQALQSKLGNANVTFDAASQAGLMKPNQLARFKALFPNQQAFADFYRTMQNEKAMFATNKAAFGNSTTAKQLLNVAEGSNPVLEGVSRVAEGVPTGNFMGVIRGIHQMGQESPMTEDTAAAIASVLSRHHGSDMADVVKRITDAQRRAALADVLRKSNGAAAGEAASRATQTPHCSSAWKIRPTPASAA